MNFRVYHVLSSIENARAITRIEGNDIVDTNTITIDGTEYQYHQVLGIPSGEWWDRCEIKFERAQTYIEDMDTKELLCDCNDYVDARLAKFWRARSIRKIKLFSKVKFL